MPFHVYDYRSVNANVLITPEIRARLYHMQPGQVDARHSHDLGHEIFLILEGKAEFNIGGHVEVLGPGQMCVARVDEIHQVRNLLEDAPTIMYLSVTPHIQPTHTLRNDDDTRLPPRFTPNAVYDDERDAARPVDDLLAAHVDAVQALAHTADETARSQAMLAAQWHAAAARGDADGVSAARNALSDGIYQLHKKLSALSDVWNELAPRGDDLR